MSSRALTTIVAFLAAAVLLVSVTTCGAGGRQASAATGTRSQVRTTAFTHIHLIPMTDNRVIEDQTVLVEGKTITAIGPADAMEVPANAVVVDGTGAYLMPGLADMHIHTRDDWQSDVWPVSPLNLFLANGVTTIRDFGPSGEPLTYALRWREDISAGKLDGPTIYTSGRMLRASPVTDAAGVVRENQDQGFDFQKLYSYLSEEDFQAGMAEARELGMYTAGHIPYAVGLDGVLGAGMDEIAHVEELDFEFIEFDKDRHLSAEEWIPYIIRAVLKQYDISQGFDLQGFRKLHGEDLSAFVDKLQRAGVPVCTTLVVDDRIVRKLFEPDAFLAHPENRYLPQAYLAAFAAGEEKHQQQFKGIEDLAPWKYGLDRLLLTELHQGDIPLLLSTDSGTGGMGIVPGFSIHDELRILTENGLTPYEALATGTVNAGRVVETMTGEGDFGTVEVGKRADLILVNGNPLEDVGHLKDLRGTMAAGRWYPRETLDDMIAPSSEPPGQE